jgi:hypothetical protein
MKQSIGIIALLFGAAVALPVYADTYDITLYYDTSPLVVGSGSFNYDPTAVSDPFSDFLVNWDYQFDFTSIANSTPNQAYGCDGGATISVFTYLTNASCQESGDAWYGDLPSYEVLSLEFSPAENAIQVEESAPVILAFPEQGDFSVTLATPEPHSVIVMSIALLALAFVVRKRNARNQLS